VGARVEQDPTSFLCLFKVLDHSLEIESSGSRIIVGILDPIETCSFDDSVMITPRWFGDINFSWNVIRDKFKSDSQSTSS